MITEVLITVDTEFSIAGAFDDFEMYPPLGKVVVEGETGGKENGLGFILDTLREFEVEATFFVEAVNTRYFGSAEMGDIAHRIRSEGQDVQLHAHPVWAVFNGHSIAVSETFPRNDSLLDRSESQVARVLEIGMDSFNAWGLDAPVAIRTGSLIAGEGLYAVFKRFGIQVSSSVGTGIYMPGEPQLQLDSGKQTVDGVIEIPVTTFRDFPSVRPQHRKSLQITSCSWPEIRSILLTANALGIRRVVLLTHAFEFFKRKDFRHSKITRNRVNQARLVNLCRFLAENRDRFRATTFSAGAKAWIDEPDVLDPVLRSPGDAHAVIRKLHNGLNDAIWPY